MGEMAEYYLQMQEDEWLRKSFPGESFSEWCARESEQARVEEVMEVLNGVLKALGDGSYWITKRRAKLKISAMTKRHAENVVGWLERRARILHDHACLQMAAGPEPSGDAASDEFNAGFNELNEMDPKEWLNQTPLVVNLRARAARRLTQVA